MTVSQVDIANAALGKLGQDIAIAAMSERTKHGVLFNRVWERVRDYVLADHPWPFAVKSVALSLLVQDPPPGWQYRYSYPADCLDALALTDESGVRVALTYAAAGGWNMSDFRNVFGDGRYDFEVVHGTQDTSIVTDLPGAYLVYASRVEEVARYPAHFVEALACRLAWDAAPAIAGELGLRMRQSLLQDYEIAKAKAAAHANNQSRDVLQPVTPALAARL